MYALPWGVDSFAGEDKSRIYKMVQVNLKFGVQINRWQFVAKIPHLHEDNENKLRARISKIVTFYDL